MNGMNATTAIATVSPQAMMNLQSKAQARVADILDFTFDIDELDFWLRHYDRQRQEAIEKGDITGAILAEYILTGLEQVLRQ